MGSSRTSSDVDTFAGARCNALLVAALPAVRCMARTSVGCHAVGCHGVGGHGAMDPVTCLSRVVGRPWLVSGSFAFERGAMPGWRITGERSHSARSGGKGGRLKSEDSSYRLSPPGQPQPTLFAPD